MASKNRAKERGYSLFRVPENLESIELLYKSLSQPSSGFSLCRTEPEERKKIFVFFDGDPLVERIHIIDMANPPLGPMELQQTIIDTYEKSKPKKDIFFIYNIENSTTLLKKGADNFFQGMNLIRDFFMQFEAEFVFFVSESLVNTIIKNAFDFYDWIKFTFIFVPEAPAPQTLKTREREKAKYSKPLEKIEYLESSIKKSKNEKVRSTQLLELGKLSVQVDDFDKALERFNEALTIERKIDDLNSMAILYHEIGLVHEAKGNFDRASIFFQKAVKIFEKNNDRENLDAVRGHIDRVKQSKKEKKSAAGKKIAARTAKVDEFDWDGLLNRIENKKVIPVIGQGLYRVDIESKGISNVLLYDYLAERIAEECGYMVEPNERHRFAAACLAYLKKTNNDYLRLSDFLKNALKDIRLAPGGPLWKLARIKNFNFFITTVYDDLLADTINTIQPVPAKVLSYPHKGHYSQGLDRAVFALIRDVQGTLVFHIFGNMAISVYPAYTEGDMLESLMEFDKHSARKPESNLSQILTINNLLFIGCGFDDWMYRFFIRVISNKPYQYSWDRFTHNYVVDNFANPQNNSFIKLARFLSDYDTQIFQNGSSDFVEELFEKLQSRYPEMIIP